MLEAMTKLMEEYKMLPPGTRVLCAVSGGADSICLLYRLALLRPLMGFELAAAHYNHRLRGEESDRDQRFVESFVRICCGSVRYLRPDGAVEELPAVPLVIGGGDVAAESERTGCGLEETARKMRYAFLTQAAEELSCDYIATAHTADDNLETFLLHLLRGSGLRGLSGIAPVRGKLIRPMLTTTRVQVEEFLHHYGLPHMEDSSNGDDTYTRNRLRHQVMPLLTSIQPELGRRLTGAMELLRADEEYLEALAEPVSGQAVPCEGGLSLDAAVIAAQPEPVASRAVRQLIGRMARGNDNCTAAHLRSVTALCRGDDPSARVSLPGGLTARRVYGRLELTYSPIPSPLEETVLPLPGKIQAGGFQIEVHRESYDGSPHAPLTFALSRARVGEELTVRRRRTGDTLSRPGRPVGTVKKRMIEEKFPRHLRENVPVFDCGGRVAAVAGLGPDAAFLPQPGEDAWRVTCTPLHNKKQKGSHRNDGNGTGYSGGFVFSGAAGPAGE